MSSGTDCNLKKSSDAGPCERGISCCAFAKVLRLFSGVSSDAIEEVVEYSGTVES